MNKHKSKNMGVSILIIN